MFDPVKFLLVGVVALVVLGPEKLPGAARKASKLIVDLRKLRASLEQEVQKAVGDFPFVEDLQSARTTVHSVRDPRRALTQLVGGLSISDAFPPAVGTNDIEANEALPVRRSISPRLDSDTPQVSAVGGARTETAGGIEVDADPWEVGGGPTAIDAPLEGSAFDPTSN